MSRKSYTLPPGLIVLVVENDTPAQELIQWLLPDSYEVQVVVDAVAAGEAIAQQTYDLVLMDIDLGGSKSGIDVLHEMSERAASTTKVLAVTAYAMPGDRDRLLEAGFDGYLAKPFTRDRFMEAVADVLDAG